MNKKKLPPEIIALIHHVRLNEAGWWEKSIERIIIATFWMSGEKLLTIKNIQKLLLDDLSIKMTDEKIQMILDSLKKSDFIISIRQNEYKLTEEKKCLLQKEFDSYSEIESATMKLFIALLEKNEITIDGKTIWFDFNTNFLLPLISDLGVKTYEIISGEGFTNNKKVQQNSEFYENYPEVTEKLKTVIVQFLDIKNQNVKDYIFIQLNAFLFIESGNLKEDILKKISSSTKRKRTLKLFVDSNFIFSVLNLHSNPANEATGALLKLITKTSNQINIELYFTPFTKDEVLRVLSYQESVLKKILISTNIEKIISQSNVGGFVKKYFEAYKKSQHALSVDDYLAPYFNELTNTLKAKNISYHDVDTSLYQNDQRVIDDILYQQDHEKKIKHKKPKTYLQLEHDICLYYLTKDMRPRMFDSIVDNEYWIITIDNNFLHYDRYKDDFYKNHGMKQNPICLHPATLIQMLQLWVPRSKEFENAMMGNLKLPFLFNKFDIEAEKVTLRILSTISRYENAGDLPEETITSILYSESLRNKMQDTKEVEEEIALIHDELILINAETKSELSLSKNEKKKLAAELAKEREEKNNYEKRLQNEKDRTVKIEKELEQLKKDKTIREQKETIASEKKKFIFIPFFIMILINWFVTKNLNDSIHATPLLITICFIYFVIWINILYFKWKDKALFKTTFWFRFTVFFKKSVNWISITIIALILGIILNDACIQNIYLKNFFKTIQGVYITQRP